MLRSALPLPLIGVDLFIRRSREVFLFISLLLITFSSFAAVPNIEFELVARSGSTQIPGGVGAFTGFSEAPVIDREGNIAFVGAGGADGSFSNQSGIYTVINGQYRKVADKKTLIPDTGGERFTVFYGSDLNDIDAGRVAFRANTDAAGTVMGLFTNVGQPSSGDLVELAIADGNEWSEIAYPWIDSGKVAMRGKLPSGQTKILIWDSSDLSMDLINPGTGYVVSPGNQPSISGNATMYRRYKSGSSQMVIDRAGSIEVLATIGSTPLPGKAGLTFSNFNYYPALDRGGSDAAFQATGGSLRGVYKRTNGGALRAVADTTTAVPGASSNDFYWFYDDGIAIANGHTVFAADGQNFLSGIYTDIGGTLSVIVDDQNNNRIEINGQTFQIRDFKFSSKSLAYTPDGYMIAFRAALQSGGTAIIKATIRTGTVTSSPNISVSGNGAFGSVNIGSASTRIVTVRNTGNADLLLGNLYGLVAPFSMLSNTCSGARLAPSGSCTVNIRFSPTATGTRSDTLIIPSNDPDQANANFAVSGTGSTSVVTTKPDITISGNGAFGSVPIGSTSTRNVTIRNSGDANLIINNMFGLVSPFSITTDNCSGKSLPPTGTCGISIRFTPRIQGSQSDLLLISSNDPDEPYSSFAVSGTSTTATSTTPDISVSGNGAFGKVTTGNSSTRIVTVRNVGTANLVMGYLSGLAAPFAIVSNSCNNASIPPSGSCSVSVRFSPTVTGFRTDTLIIPSNDPDEGYVNFAVNGEGTNGSAQEEKILSEGFEDGNLNGWSTDGNVGIDGILAIGNYSLLLTKSATSTLRVSTAGYSDVSIAMNLAASSLDSGEACYAEISTNGGGSWIKVVQVLSSSNDSNWYSGTVSPASADDNPNLQLRFRSTGSRKPDYCYGDNVIVSGTLK